MTFALRGYPSDMRLCFVNSDLDILPLLPSCYRLSAIFPLAQVVSSILSNISLISTQPRSQSWWRTLYSARFFRVFVRGGGGTYCRAVPPHMMGMSEKRAAVAREPARAHSAVHFRPRPCTKYGRPLFHTSVYGGTRLRPVRACLTAFGHDYKIRQRK